MRKLFLVTILLFIGVAFSYAQVELKALVGTNLTKFGNDDNDVSAKAGFQFGGGVLIGDKFYVEPGIQFVRNSKTLTMETTELAFDQNFVKIPVYAGYHVLGHESGPLAMRVFGGPTVSIPGKISGGDHGITKDDINNALWAVDAGIGLDILFLFVEVNYEYTMTKTFKDETIDSKNRGIIINAGIHIDF
ncbi:Outer membrane protein beta-barrel domain-containing protein [Mariniphaga anaerophila]|uniref:Outer membrane protein beta-barrel domain-containing protein n=1 Tax=Mariniphaga anaerophila TaxID=1484053 RepID=A0A1M5ENR3_9BACT|nr:outer membrane beta-barrel protein [Mariniphaga anaerophila]SHF80731.1 Outer membrane protein beta-barrel domain-containing protein [Mariniphaga anaerophila]